MQNPPTLPAEITQELVAVGDTVKLICEKASDLSVKNTEEAEFATRFLGEVKSEIRTTDDHRKRLVKPFQDAVKNLNNEFKNRIEPMQKVERIVKQKLADHLDAEEKKREEEAARVAEEQRKKEEAAQKKIDAAKSDAAREKAEENLQKVAEEAPEVEAAETSIRTSAGLASTRKIWDFEVKKENEIPREFLKIDETKIRQKIRDGEREIKGLKIFQKTSVSVRP